RLIIYTILIFIFMKITPDETSMLVFRIHMAFCAAIYLYWISDAMVRSKNIIISIGAMLLSNMAFYGIKEIHILKGNIETVSDIFFGILTMILFVFSLSYFHENYAKEPGKIHFEYDRTLSRWPYKWWMILLSLFILLFINIQGLNFFSYILDSNPAQFNFLLILCWMLYSFSLIALIIFLEKFKISFVLSILISLAGCAFTIGLTSFNNIILTYSSFVIFSILTAIVDYIFLTVFMAYAIKIRKCTGFAWGIIAYCVITEFASFNAVFFVDVFREYNFAFLLALILICLIAIPILIVRKKNKTSNDLSITSRKKESLCLEEELRNKLTPSEKQVFELMCKGYTNQQLSEKLMITESTVKFHIRNILRKADARNRYDLLSMLRG
ncbi:MAG: helix-turn-helix transcriptional regulator, partial [Clostridia bacterium]|nr:helix-turn-helix transcriptional regulator [Clostridia bacterium]